MEKMEAELIIKWTNEIIIRFDYKGIKKSVIKQANIIINRKVKNLNFSFWE
jgi:hypothetical protein